MLIDPIYAKTATVQSDKESIAYEMSISMSLGPESGSLPYASTDSTFDLSLCLSSRIGLAVKADNILIGETCPS